MTQPFSIFPTDLLAHELSALELRVLIALYSFRSKNTNTVWPSLESLAKVAGVSDVTTVSKVTTRLAAKGMLTKKKRGFTGCNSYDLLVPEKNESPNLDKTSNLDKKTMGDLSNLDESSKLAPSANPIWTNHPSANLDESSKCNEVTIEVTNEHTSVVALIPKTSVAVAPATTKKSGTRLPREWALPKDWGNWALGKGHTKDSVLLEAEKFRNHWIAKSGKDATKLDWEATWRNWILNSEKPNSKTLYEKTREAKERDADKRLTGLANASADELQQLGLA